MPQPFTSSRPRPVSTSSPSPSTPRASRAPDGPYRNGAARPGAGPPPGADPSARAAARPGLRARPGGDKPEHEILFQTYFKSVGPRTYASQVKKAANGNHYLVLTEGKRDDATGDVRKSRLFIYSEDFVSFFRMLQQTAQFIKGNPVPDDVKRKRDRFWARRSEAPAKASQSRDRTHQP